MSGWTQPFHTGGKWIISATALDELYPCRCEEPDPDPPAWKRERALRGGSRVVYRCDPYQRKTDGAWRNRCFCWGRLRDERLPDGCCSNHDANPRYAVVVEGVLIDPAVEPPDKPGVPPPAEVDEVELPPDDVPLELGQEFADETGDWPSIRMPYTPRWTHAERHCECPTPWDTETRIGGYHCVSCHTNWRNLGVAMLHQRTVLDRCKAPASIVDCETGDPIVRMRMEGEHVVWG